MWQNIRNTVSQLWFAPHHPWCKSPIQPHPKDDLLDWDLVNVVAIWVQWTPCLVQETILRWFELFDMVCYPAGSWHQKMVSKNNDHLRLWYLNDGTFGPKGTKVCHENIRHTITPPPPSSYTVDYKFILRRSWTRVSNKVAGEGICLKGLKWSSLAFGVISLHFNYLFMYFQSWMLCPSSQRWRRASILFPTQKSNPNICD